MSFADSPECVASELARSLDTYPSVVAATIVPEGRGPDPDRVTLEVLAERTARGTLPNTVAHAVVRSSLGLADVTDANNPDYKRAVIQ